MVDIEGYAGLYAVTEDGRVWSYRSQKFLKLYSDCWGYYRVGLWERNKMKNYQVHRLVANAYIPNPNNYPCVNHKDEDKSNNNVSNLEWCTYAYNNIYGNRLSSETRKKIGEASKGRQTWSGKHHSQESKKKMSEAHKGKTLSEEHKRKVGVALKGHKVSDDGRKRIGEAHSKAVRCVETGEIFSSITKAQEATHIHKSNISSCCRGKAKTAGGYHWEFVEKVFNKED